MTEPNKSEDLWTPYKELLHNVTTYLNGEFRSECYTEFENILKQYKQTFYSLLQNPPKSAKCREELKKGMEEGINVREHTHQVLSKELYQEAIILSDMYNLNEFSALDLLCTAQIQMSYYPGLPRGLVAVLLYYDGRKAILSVLRMLVQARKGVLWCIKIPGDVEQFITTYTDQLMEGGLFNRIFELLRTLDLSKEIEKLQQNVALGGPKHQRQVIDLFNNIRLILGDIVFLWASQSGLSKQPTLGLINYLREQKFEEESTGKIDNVNLYMISGFLAALNLSVLHEREDGEEAIQNLPILAEGDFVEAILNELSQNKPWQCSGLQATAKFGFAVCLSSLRLIPQSRRMQNLIEQEDIFCDAAIEGKVFRYITNVIFTNDLIYTEDVLYKRYHNLISDFIVYMYTKVKELRIKADEIARTMQVYANEGLEPPVNLPRHFEDFLFFVAKFYEKDPLKLKAMLEYWCPLDQINLNGSHRAPSRSVSLFKFVKLAGDVIPSTLFVPYLTMLASLSGCQQAARYCFNMLKQTTPGLQTTLSWDHFFMSFSQYYSNLRQEMPLASDTVYRHRSTYLKGITPQEIHGLQAVLKLLKAIASQDEFSRMSLCEHPAWAPLSILLGLVSCSVPIPLKAEILSTLAALSKSPETASQMWNNLEASQILITVPSTSSYQPRGIQTELDEVESRMEEYPLTKSLLELLDVLTEFGIPRNLGAGPRVPGFDPYLTFIVNSVFLKFHTRSYKNPEEKWEIAGLCLKLFEKFIIQYIPDVTDFQNASKPDKSNSPPGFHIMVQLNTKSNVLNLILFILHEGITLFDTYKHFTAETFINKCTLSCMNIIEKGLLLQNRFFQLLSSAPFGVPMVQLSKLLMSINQCSNKPDHVLNIARYTNHQITIPAHCLVAINIIIQLTSSTLTHNQLMSIILSDTDSNKSIRCGFVECLDAPIDSNEDTDVNSLTKDAILTLLRQCLPYKAPNLSHYLFGFDLKKDISFTIFQVPGVIDFPRTCIHSLFGLLKLALTPGIPIKPGLLESGYQMLYALCANHKTSEPTLKLLRMIPNFLKDHILDRYKNINDGISVVNQLSWLLMTTAIELKVCCRTKQINYMKQLTQLLVDMPPSDTSSKFDPFTVLPSEASKIILNDSLSVYSTLQDYSKLNNLLIKLIVQFDFNIKEVVAPNWEFFDTNVLNSILNSCYTGTKPKLIDIKKVHQILMDELGNIQGTAAIGQRQAILREIQKVLLHALNINNSRRTAASMIKFIDAWRQVVEVLVLFVPYEILNADDQQILQIFILEQLLGKVVKALLLPDIGNYLSGATIILLDNLRRCHIYSEKQRCASRKPTDLNKNTLSIIQSNSASLRIILTNLIDWILTADVTAQKLRVNLYGALATFLHLINIEDYDDLQVNDSLYVSRLDNSKLKIQSESYTIQLSSDIFSVFNEKLIEVLCHDCAGGQDICRMLAMASFSLLITLTGNTNWIVYYSGRGYLKHTIQSILDSDQDLQLAMEPMPENLKPLYIYESKMSFLTRIATTRVGAELLLEQNLLSTLCNMKVFDYHPEITKDFSEEQMLIDNIPPLTTRYLQLWLPTLHICEAILTSLGTENRSSVAQVTHYILTHIDVIEMILRAGSPFLSNDHLKELSLITELIARTANNDLITILDAEDSSAYLHRLQKLMLNLLPKFILTETIIKELLTHSPTVNDTTYQTSERLLHAMKIVVNLMLYARNLVANHGIEHSGVGIIFQATLSESLNGQQTKGYNDHLPSLGVIMQHLINTVQYYHKEKITLNYLQSKLSDIPNMNTVDLKEFMPTIQKMFDLSMMRKNVYEMIAEKLKMKKLEIGYATFIIEHSLYLIWVHLDYYMLKAIVKTQKKNIVGLNTTINFDSTLPSSSEVTWRVSADDVSNLKQGLVSIFTDSFSNQLVETADENAKSDRGLVEALLRKIKRLIQFVPVK
nr:nuclear pore complex protein Nup205 [Onthophagus taurus]